jgi:hypothetical protein
MFSAKHSIVHALKTKSDDLVSVDLKQKGQLSGDIDRVWSYLVRNV